MIAAWVIVAGFIGLAIAAGIAFRVWFALRAFVRAPHRRNNGSDEHAHWLGIGGTSFLHGARD